MRPMNAYERFTSPADYIVDNMRNAQYSSPNGKDIHYNPIDSTNTLASFIITAESIRVCREGEVRPRTMSELMECQKSLEKESSFHPLKAAILRVPRPNHVYLGYYDEEHDSVTFGGNSDKAYFRLNGSGHLQRLNFSDVPSVEDVNYAWLLTSYIVMSFDSRRRETKC